MRHVLNLAVCATLLSMTACFVGPPRFGSVTHSSPVERQHSTSLQHSTFEQLIDHKNPELGTFPQRYWYNDMFWVQPGSPIILSTPGESDVADSTWLMTDASLLGKFAEAIEGAIVLLEHRYWGHSSPYANLTMKNLRYLTVEQSIADLTYFATTVRLPFDLAKTSGPKYAPWVLYGCSYSGALAAWTASTSPGTFWAYSASSAPVESISNYWQYFVPIQEGMAKNCSKDVALVIDHVDHILQTGTDDHKATLKDRFMLGDLPHDDDFAYALALPLFSWQGNRFYRNAGFFGFCDYIQNAENASLPIPGASGVGVTKALDGYARWFITNISKDYCRVTHGHNVWQHDSNTDCLSTYNASSARYTDYRVPNRSDRQWMWLICNQLGYWQDGAPAGRPTIVSRLVDVEYFKRQCGLYFPIDGGYTFGTAAGDPETGVNTWTKGWDIDHIPRLLFVNGQYDPWREASTSSDFRHGGPLRNTTTEPVYLIPGGYHCSDLTYRNALVNEGVRRVVDAEIAQIKTWVDEYPRRYASVSGPER